MASEINSIFYSVSSSDLVSSWVGESEKYVKQNRFTCRLLMNIFINYYKSQKSLETIQLHSCAINGLVYLQSCLELARKIPSLVAPHFLSKFFAVFFFSLKLFHTSLVVTLSLNPSSKTVNKPRGKHGHAKSCG